MALIIYHTGQKKFVPDRTARTMWLVKHGLKPVESLRQKRYLDEVREIQLSDIHTMPDEYIRRNLPYLVPKIVANWMVDQNGRPSRPSTREDYIFAEKWGLWSQGRPTALVIDPEQQMILV